MKKKNKSMKKKNKKYNCVHCAMKDLFPTYKIVEREPTLEEKMKKLAQDVLSKF